MRIPPSTDGSKTIIKKLTTDLSIFVHNLGDLKHTLHFNELALSTTNTPIHAQVCSSLIPYLVHTLTHLQSVVADVAFAHSSNGVISGHYNTSDSVVLETTNAPITAVIGLLNDHSGEATKARIHTTNG